MTKRKTGSAKKAQEPSGARAVEGKLTTDSKTELPAPPAGSAANFPVVGIGASAGGLAAFEAFFSGMPTDTNPNMAFVLVQHLAPDHKSMLTDLIGRFTRMQVFEVEDGMQVQPNCAYIIPPNRDMAFIDGTLQLLSPVEPRGQRLPIDFFFRSLALDQRERAIGIVLSGTGSDGTLGVRAIKAEGGMVMAQDPDSAEFDGMPLRTHVGHDFSQYKPSTILRRIERRMAVHQLENIDSYVRYLRQAPSEVEALCGQLHALQQIMLERLQAPVWRSVGGIGPRPAAPT
jgi:two-component system CheB/CheR fusion protein